jgi:hypothetical protein
LKNKNSKFMNGLRWVTPKCSSNSLILRRICVISHILLIFDNLFSNSYSIYILRILLIKYYILFKTGNNWFIWQMHKNTFRNVSGCSGGRRSFCIGIRSKVGFIDSNWTKESKNCSYFWVSRAFFYCDNQNKSRIHSSASLKAI